MSLDSVFAQPDEEVDLKQRIVEELLNSEKNLYAKTEMTKPLRWSCLNTIEKYIDSKKLPVSSNILRTFMDTSFLYLISNERKGRLEYVEALKSLAGMQEEPQEDMGNLMN